MIRSSLSASLAGVALALLVAPTASLAQTEAVITSRSVCDRCRIVLDREVKLGDRDGLGVIGRPKAVARDSRGRYYVVSEEWAHRIAVFDEDGDFMTALGRAGEGPSEFQTIDRMVFGPGDTLYVFDGRNGRVAVVGPEGNVVRTARVAGWASSAARLPDGRFVVASSVLTPESIGYPLHVVTAEGGVESSFGVESPVMRRDMFYEAIRVVTVTPDGQILSARYLQYLIESFNSDGEPLARWARQAEWMPPQSSQIQMTDEQQEHPKFVDLWADDQGILWTAIRVNEPRWYRGLGEPTGTMEGRVWPIEDIDEVFGTRIEALDLARNELLASEETDEMVVGFLGDNRLVTYTESDWGVPRLSIWRIELRR